jgi:hypothetical protein
MKSSEKSSQLLNILCASYMVFSWFGIAFLLWQTEGRVSENWVSTLLIVLFFGGFIVGILPYVDIAKLKIGSLVEIERRLERIESTTFLGKVIKPPFGKKYYVTEDGKHLIPDEETANFLQPPTGEVEITYEELNRIPDAEPLESVYRAPIKMWNRQHIFIILAGRIFHVASAVLLARWNRAQKEYQDIGTEELRKYKIGR